jgi:hypothetical protein
MAVKYVKDFDFSKGTASCNYAKGGSAKKPAGMMIVIGVGKPKGPMRKAEGGSISDSDRRMMEQMAGDANAYTEAQRMMGQGATSDADRSAMKAAAAKKKAAPAAKKGSPYIPGTNVKANDLYTKEELERLERGYKKGGKVAKVMHEFGEGKLHSGSKEGPKVTSRKQAVAIALSEAGKMKKAKGGMAKHPDEAMDKALIKKMVKPGVLKKADGGMAQKVQMAKSNAVAASLKGQKKTGYADGGMAMDNIVKAAAGRPMPGQQIPADVMSRYAASPGAGGMGSMGKANPYAMGPGGREYESAMDKQSNQMPVPQRGATGLGSLTAADASRLGNAVMAPQRGAPPAPMPVPQRGAASMRPASGPMPTPLRGAPPRPAPAPPAPMMRGSKSLKDPVSGRATGLGPLVQEPARPALAPPMRRAEGGMASIKSPLQRMSRAKGVPVASEMPMIESKSSGPKSIGVNAKRPGGPNVGKIRAAMARAASKAVPENAPSMMKKGGKVK